MVRPPLRAPRVKNNLYRSRARPTRLGAPFVRTVRPGYVCEGMRAFVAGLLLATVWLAEPRTAAALSVQEAIPRAKPSAALITAEIQADVTMNCGQGLVTVSPAPFVETGTGWFVDGRGFLVTNAHVVDPAYRLPPWVTHELKKKAIEQACVEPVLRARGLMRGQRPDVEEQVRRQASDQALATAKVTPSPKVTVMLSNGLKLQAEVKKFSPPLLLDNDGRPLPDSGRDLALLRVNEGLYPAITLSTRDSQIGDPVHILGFPGVVLSHELLNRSVTLEASVTNGAVSGFKQDAIGQDVIQSDAPAAHGNSGGPAVTDDAALVGVGDPRRHAALVRRLRRHVGPAVVEEPVPYPADAGDRLHRARAQPRAPRRADQERLRDEPTQATRRRPARSGERGDGEPELRARPAPRRVLHEPGRGHERACRPRAPPARLQERADPQGRARRLDQCAAARRGQVLPAIDRPRDLHEPPARRRRAAEVQRGRGHFPRGRRPARRGVRDPRGRGRDPASPRRRREDAQPARGGPALRRDGALPEGSAVGERRRYERHRAPHHQGRAARAAHPEPPAAHHRGLEEPVEPGRRHRQGARGDRHRQMTPRSRRRARSARESPSRPA